MEPIKLGLDNIGRGELAGMVEREIRKVCENIADPAVETSGVRTITVKIKIKPDSKGQTAKIAYFANSALLPVDGGEETVYIGMGPDNQMALWSMDLRQGSLPLDRKEPAVTEIKPVGTTPKAVHGKPAAYAPPPTSAN
jgi:hypothetical protein